MAWEKGGIGSERKGFHPDAHKPAAPKHKAQATPNGVDKWSERHVGSLALTRTILGFVNILLAVVIILKVY